jgi:hypothetical protein
MVFRSLELTATRRHHPLFPSPRRCKSSQTARSWHLDEPRQGETSIERAISPLGRSEKRARMRDEPLKGMDKLVVSRGVGSPPYAFLLRIRLEKLYVPSEAQKVIRSPTRVWPTANRLPNGNRGVTTPFSYRSIFCAH